MTDDHEVVLRRGREGGRWINERPTPEGFAEWFTGSMKIDPALDVADYIGGVVLIPAVDTKAKQVVGFNKDGHPIMDTREELSYIPYAKVEARTAYWWDLLDAHSEWVGVVENVASPRMPIDQVTVSEAETIAGSENAPERLIARERITPGALATMVHQLPEGFSIMSVPVRDGYTHFLCATIRVSIFRADENGEPKGRPLRTGRGTKQVPILTGYRDNPWADPAALMKAETGAMGRALGFAGIFVIPGSGVATAEDMLEAIAQGAPPTSTAEAGNAGPAAPIDPPVRSGAEQKQETDTDLLARASKLYKTLADERPAKATEFGAWARERKLTSLGDARGAVLRGAVRKLEKLTDEPYAPAVTSTPEAAGAPVGGPEAG